MLERLLAERDWGKVFAQLNLVVKPAIDTLFNASLAAAAAANGDDMTALMHRNLHLDSARSRRWSMALVAVALQDAPGNGEVLRRWIGEAAPAVTEAVAAAAAPLSTPAYTLAPEQTRQVAAEAIQASARPFGLAAVT